MSLPAFRECERNGVDQGVHNVIVHLKMLERRFGIEVKTHNQSYGPVANLQAGVMTVGKDFIVRNKAREATAIVHQYDRNEELMTYLMKKFVDWEIHPESVGSGLCSGYTIKENTESFKGRCDLSHEGPASSYDQCCTICNSFRDCVAFTHIRKGCFLKSCGINEGGGIQGGEALTVVGATGGWKR
jgi:hypothetical protein